MMMIMMMVMMICLSVTPALTAYLGSEKGFGSARTTERWIDLMFLDDDGGDHDDDGHDGDDGSGGDDGGDDVFLVALSVLSYWSVY